MFQIFDFLAIPLGFVLKLIYNLVGNHYLLAIFLFTLLMKIILFPLSLHTQKGQADRAKLAPRIERLQKKYGDDRQKLQQKTQELYEKEGVKMTAGCAPMLLQMVVLFGIIATIYKPLSYLSDIPTAVISQSIEAVTLENYAPENMTAEQKNELLKTKFEKTQLQGYYGELKMLSRLEVNRDAVLENIRGIQNDPAVDPAKAEEYYDAMLSMTKSMQIGSISLLEQPWRDNGFAGINWLWIIPIVSGLTAFATSFITNRLTKKMQPQGEAVPGQGCTTAMTMGMMPLFSLYISFVVPAGVGLYWIFSNLLGIVQTIILNKIYDPVKIRAQAEIEYEERRRQRAADRKRLAEIHRQEESAAAEAAAAEAEEARRSKKKKQPVGQGETASAEDTAAPAAAEESAVEVSPEDTDTPAE